MKKMFTVLVLSVLLLTMLLPVTASAATISLRNGIQFGDTMSQVISKETLAISSRDTNKVETVAGTIYVGGYVISNVSIVYHFDNYGKLCDIVWMLPKGYSTSAIDAVYEGLKGTYGRPTRASYSSGYPVMGKAYNGAADLVSLYKMCGMYGKLSAYDEWVLGDTKIEFIIAEVGYSSRSTEYVCFVGFKYIGR